MTSLAPAATSALPTRPDPAPLRVAPEPHESARSLLLRVAARNFCSVEEINGWLGLPAPSAPLSGDLTRAARLLGIDADRLERMGFEDEESGWVLGHKIPVGRLYRTVRCFCPECLAERPYYRRIWDLRQLDVCPLHSRQLVSRCHECGVNIRWHNEWSHETCGCGAPLAKPGTSSTVDDCTGARAVYLHCGLPAGGDAGKLPPAFSAFPLGSLLDLLFFFGRMDVVVARGNPDRLLPRQMLKDRGILNAGARVALGWPESFGHLAERVRASRPDKPGVMRQYGYLHRFIERAGDEPYADLLREAYAAHLSERGDIPARSWPPFLPPPSASLHAMTSMEVQRALGCGPNSFNALRRQPLWTSIRPVLSTRNGVPQYDPAEIAALKAKVSRLTSPGVAERTLGLGRGKLNLLIEAGLVEVHRWNRHHRNSEDRSVDLADLEALFRRIRDLAVEEAPARPVFFGKLLEMATARRVVSYVDVIRCLLSGELRGHLAHPDLPGLAPLSFGYADAAAMLDRLAAPARSGKIVLGLVKRRLGITARAVHELVEKGLLAEPERVCAYIFRVADVEAFMATFVFDSTLACRKDSTPFEVRKALAVAGIRPVAVITVRGVGVGVYRRQDLGPLAQLPPGA